VSTHSDELVFFVVTRVVLIPIDVVCSIVGIFVVVILMAVVWSIPGKTGEKNEWTHGFNKSLKISKEQSESVYRRRTDNAMAKRKSTKGQTTIYKTYI